MSLSETLHLSLDSLFVSSTVFQRKSSSFTSNLVQKHSLPYRSISVNSRITCYVQYKHLMCSDVLNNPYKYNYSILQMRQRRLQEAKQRAQGHTAKTDTSNMNQRNNLKYGLNFNCFSLFFLTMVLLANFCKL